MTSDLPKDLEERLEKVAKHLSVTKQYCIEQALLQYIANWEKVNGKLFDEVGSKGIKS